MVKYVIGCDTGNGASDKSRKQIPVIMRGHYKYHEIRNKEFGFVFQSFFMNSNDSVLNNVILPLKINGVGFRERRRRAMEALRVVELDDKAKNKANDLSGGQKQRVCIARAIVNNPKVIFADEPTGNLDSATGERIEKLLFSPINATAKFISPMAKYSVKKIAKISISPISTATATMMACGTTIRQSILTWRKTNEIFRYRKRRKRQFATQ